MFTAVPMYAVGFLYNAIYSITAIAIPLYGLYAGYSATQIGLLLSIPGVLTVILRMGTGLLSDRFGEKNMLIFTFCLTVLSGLVFVYGLSFSNLAVFQVIMGISRAIFFPTSQSYVSRISSTKSSTVIGRYHSFIETGKLSGMLFAGWAVTKIGYLATFRLIAFIGFLGLLIVWILRNIPLTTGERSKIKNIGDSFIGLVKKPPLQLALITAFTAGLLAVLIQSFFPIWLKTLGKTEGLISVIVTTYLVGSLLAGRLFAKLLGRLRFPLLLQLSLGGVGTGFLLVLLVKGLITIFTLTLAVGIFAGFITISYQVMVVNNSLESNRGLIYSFVGLGWGSAFLVGPTLFGLLVDGYTVTVAFACLGILLLLCAVFIKAVYTRFTESYAKGKSVSVASRK